MVEVIPARACSRSRSWCERLIHRFCFRSDGCGVTRRQGHQSGFRRQRGLSATIGDGDHDLATCQVSHFGNAFGFDLVEGIGRDRVESKIDSGLPKLLKVFQPQVIPDGDLFQLVMERSQVVSSLGRSSSNFEHLSSCLHHRNLGRRSPRLNAGQILQGLLEQFNLPLCGLIGNGPRRIDGNQVDDAQFAHGVQELLAVALPCNDVNFPHGNDHGHSSRRCSSS